MPDLQAEIAVVGAGLSGLATTRALISEGCSVILLEARDRVGGRMLSEQGTAGTGYWYDLGPAWIWPHNQRVQRLAHSLGVHLMPQYSRGNLVFEDQNGHIRRDLEFAPMGDALRIEGGMARLAEAVAGDFPEGILHLGHQVKLVETEGTRVRISGQAGGAPFSATARQVVLSLPPRLVSAGIQFSPSLAGADEQRLAAVPTWMAGQGKFVATYDDAFWRRSGLSGDAISHRGPLFEIHDASGALDPRGAGALFGFVAPGRLEAREGRESFNEDAIAQLTALFGLEAAHPSLVHLKDWSADPWTATPLDRPDLGGHPSYRPMALAGDVWKGRVHLSGSETAPENGGFVEGALEAAEQTLVALNFGATTATAYSAGAAR